MQTIVIFGATGNLGSYVAVDLQQAGYNVVATGHRKSDNGFFATKGITYYSVDINDPTSFAVLPQTDVYAVVHLAGELPSRYDYQPQRLLSSIILGTYNVLEYMRTVGATKIIFPQTPFDLYQFHNTETAIEADMPRSFPPTGDHSVYTIAKNAAVDLIEHYVATYGFSRFILRFFTIYQYHPNPYHYADYTRKKMPYRILMDKALRGEPIAIWGDPTRRKEIVYIKDFTQLVRKAVESNRVGGIYNVGGQQTVSLEEQIRGIVEVFSPKDHPSPIVYEPDKPNALQAHFDISKTKSELGYEPQYSYIEAMQDFYHEMQTEPFAQLWGKASDYEE